MSGNLIRGVWNNQSYSMIKDELIVVEHQVDGTRLLIYNRKTIY